MKKYFKYLNIIFLNINVDKFYYHFHFDLTYNDKLILYCCHSNNVHIYMQTPRLKTQCQGLIL